MTTRVIGYAPMLEQTPPRDVITLARLAEQAGLSGVLLSDAFQPWIPAQGQAGSLWPVLAAVAEHTTGPLGAVCSPGPRAHPAVLAQHAATLADLHPGRAWLGLSSGEALNDAITGEYWPRAAHRIDRVFEGAELIDRLFANSAAGRDTVFAGEHARLDGARLWTLPEQRPPLLIAAGGPVTARRAGRSADGFVTMGAGPGHARTLMERFRRGRAEAGADPGGGTTVVRLHLSWAATESAARDQAVARWPNGAMNFAKADIRTPFDFAQLARLIGPDDFGDLVHISADPASHAANIQSYLDAGFDQVYLHQVGANQVAWFEVLATQILPALTH